jgi:hypothetical protein
MKEEVVRIRCSRQTKLKWARLATECRVLRGMSAEDLLNYLMDKYAQLEPTPKIIR